MIKCKQAMESSACGKVCCCLECEERESCKDVCTELSPDCEDAFSEETALATCLLYTSPSPRDRQKSRMPSSA